MNFIEYKERLLKNLQEYLCDDTDLSIEETSEWIESMINEDDTKGGRWSVSETEPFKPDGVSSHCWNACMNMMYADYCGVANKFGVSRADFYAEMARAFLEDADAKPNKLTEYYKHIVLK